MGTIKFYISRIVKKYLRFPEFLGFPGFQKKWQTSNPDNMYLCVYGSEVLANI